MSKQKLLLDSFTRLLKMRDITSVCNKIGYCTEVRFASFLSGGFITMAVINPPERKLAKRTFVHCGSYNIQQLKLVPAYSYSTIISAVQSYPLLISTGFLKYPLELKKKIQL